MVLLVQTSSQREKWQLIVTRKPVLFCFLNKRYLFSAIFPAIHFIFQTYIFFFYSSFFIFRRVQSISTFLLSARTLQEIVDFMGSTKLQFFTRILAIFSLSVLALLSHFRGQIKFERSSMGTTSSLMTRTTTLSLWSSTDSILEHYL